MQKIKVAKEGRVVEGHVMDAAKGPILQALKSYDPQLYLKWNPKKQYGIGMWEVRRRSDEKTSRFECEYQGQKIYSVEYRELGLINHVLDAPRLGYWILDHLKKIDMWQYGYKGRDTTKIAEYNEAKHDERMDDKACEDRDYQARQHKTLINDFRQFILDGGNPYRLADYWDKGKL